MANAFDKFKGSETKHVIKAMDGFEVTLRQLSLKEASKIANSMIKSVSKDGIPEMDIEKAGQVKLMKISAALVDPKMTVAQLEALSTDAREALDEIYAIVDPAAAEAVKNAEGKSDSEK